MFSSLGVDSLENFKYATLFTLYDYTPILSGVNDWIGKAVAAVSIGAVDYLQAGFISAKKICFCKKFNNNAKENLHKATKSDLGLFCYGAFDLYLTGTKPSNFKSNALAVI